MTAFAGSVLESWLCDALPWLVRPLQLTALAGGNSNVTVRAQDGDGASVVLRRGPSGSQPGTHNLLREHRILSALAATAVPAPRPLAFCADPEVWESEFSVVEYLSGTRIATTADAHALPEPERALVGHALVDGLARVHAVGLEAPELAELRRGAPYLQRQLATWSRHVRAANGPRATGLLAFAERLSPRLPLGGETVLVHGDYRLDNCLISPQLTLSAILDWELATLGDPLADLALLCVYWAHDTAANKAGIGMPVAPTTLPGFPPVARVIDAYAAASGRDLSRFADYLGFAHWKVACIADGVLWRYQQRAGEAADSSAVTAMDTQIRLDLSRAERALDRSR